VINFDIPLEWRVFSRLKSPQSAQETVWRSQMFVTGMHCAACAIKLEEALANVPGVISSQVSAASAQASILWDSNLTKPSIWMAATRRAGYELHPANDLDFEGTSNPQTKLALWRLLVAGFCMMQIMMYAAPHYFSEPGEISSDLQALMRWASWVLSLPIIFFSCGPFFKNALRDLRNRCIGMDLPVSLGIVITFILSSAATFEPQSWWGQEVYFDSLAMFVFFILTGRWLEQRLRGKTALALNFLGRESAARVERRLASGTYENIAAARLSVGDIMRILPGQRFPADGTVLRGNTFVNEAFLTGESRPLPRTEGSAVLAGSYNLSSPCEVIVERVGDTTRFSQISALMRDASLEKPRLAQLADRIARPFLALVFTAAAFAALYWWPVDPGRGLMTAVAILIVTCPCALSLATPSAILSSSGALAAHGVLVNRPQGIEALSQVDTVIFDKTGTLTKKHLGIHAIFPRQGMSESEVLQLAGALAQHSLHPVARALTGQPASKHRPPVFSKVVEVSGQGLEASLDDPGELGTTRVSLGRMTLGRAQFCGAPSVTSEKMQVYLSDSRGLVARFELDEVIRPDAVNAIALLQAYGLQVRLMSGDRQDAARATGRALGITEIESECSPEKKLQLLRGLQSAGHKVLMVGDGINDGPAISGAQVSIAMGSDVPLSQAQADFVIPNEQLSLIPILLQQARRTLRIVRQNLAWAAAYNVVCVPLAMFGYLPAWAAGLGMAASSLLVILNASRLARLKMAN
jgi:P-type Cu2+ transporter